MKKTLLILVSITALIFGSAAFAQDLGLGQSMNDNRTRYEQLINNRKEQIRDFFARAREKKAAIEKNRLEIKNLQAQLNERVRQVKARVKELKKSRDLDSGRIAMIKGTLSSIDQAHRTLGSSQGELQRKNSDLRTARQNKKPAEFLQALDDITDIQEKRINTLKRLLQDLDRLNSHLQ